MSTDKELAYRYDLLIAPDWRVRFDTLVDENIVMPPEGRFLDLNCGTGDYAIELAERLRDKGSVIGVDSSEDRIELARAKSVVLKLENITFEVLETEGLPYGDGEFDAVIGDASMFEPAGKLGDWPASPASLPPTSRCRPAHANVSGREDQARIERRISRGRRY